MKVDLRSSIMRTALTTAFSVMFFIDTGSTGLVSSSPKVLHLNQVALLVTIFIPFSISLIN